jgi:hypothetical protein
VTRRARITLDDLPLFASDAELARAIVGEERAAAWLAEKLPYLETRPGFPRRDDFHGGRSVALVRRFYERYLDATAGPQTTPAGVVEGAWKPKQARPA